MESILLEDEWYKKSDVDTKNLYKNVIQKISKKTKYSETYIASKAIELARKNNVHVGLYLLGEEKSFFLEKLGISVKEKGMKYKLSIYIFFIYLPSFIISVLTMKSFFIFGIIPLSEVFLLIVNKIISKIYKPNIIPRLDTIPDEINTFVIIPTLLNDSQKVKELIENLEVFYCSNKMDNLYFALLGDCSEEDSEHTESDDEIVKIGVEEINKLNQKYDDSRFFFLYRKRVYNPSQEKWLGYERKRGMITEFVKFLVNGEKGSFIVNTIDNIPKIKYVITLDSDTFLPIDSAKKLIGTMEHPLNTPVTDGKIVRKGYGIIQPRIEISMECSTFSFFSKIFAGDGGIDAYSTAESNVYQDFFGEAIFTGKGIFNVDLFYNLLKDEIPENTVLSHDLLEGSYLRCGLANDIYFIDSYPSKLTSYMARLHRWTRGDWQIISWLKKDVLNELSKYKIFDNLRRSLNDIFLLLLLFSKYYYVSLFSIFFPFILDVFEKTRNHRIGIKARNYLPIINGLSGSFLRGFLHLVFLPYKAVSMIKAISVTLYRMYFSKKHLLDWITACDAEKRLKNTRLNYLREVIYGPILAITFLLYAYQKLNVLILIPFLWLISPMIGYRISQKERVKKENITNVEKEELMDISKRTWHYFETSMVEKNNFLPPDNYQFDRKNSWVSITSSTNIGLGMMSIISAYDMKFVTRETCIKKLKQTIDIIVKLEKWNGHLYNWYNIKTLSPLNPRFVSTVDSGNFVGYLYVVKDFLNNNHECEYENIVTKLINDTDFSELYDYDKNLFFIGYDFRENKMVDSYYDLLASEARLASFVAIAKKDVPYKHWFSMSRTLTCVDNKKGLISWSGTMFEYFMPFIVMKSYPYTLLDETYDFCIYSQKKYSKKLVIPWGISESAFYLQDLNNNYQYKAFGVPWLGLKRGLKEEIVVAPYSSILALEKEPKAVMKNIKELKSVQSYGKFGFYDSIDYTPNHVSPHKCCVVKTYMAHHEALILLSINNYFNNGILQKRFLSNPEIKSASLLLQERVPKDVVFTKNKKEKIESLKYRNYEDHVECIESVPCGNINIQSNNNYSLIINDKGESRSYFNNILLTKFNERNQKGVQMFFKNLDNGEIISNTQEPVEITFSPSFCKFDKRNDEMHLTTRIAISPEENMESREVTIKNCSKKEMNMEIISCVEPVLAYPNSDIIHPAYNGLFLKPSLLDNAIVVEKRLHDSTLYYINFLVCNDEERQEFELDKAKIVGRLNSINNPRIIENDIAYSNQANPTTNTLVSWKKKICIQPNTSVILYFYFGVGYDKKEIEEMHNKYKSFDMGNRLFELAYAKSIVENRFLGYKGTDILLYHKLFSVLQKNNTRKDEHKRIENNILKQRDLWKFGISGDNQIIFLRIKNINDVDMLSDVIMAIEYYHKKNIFVDLVIFDEEDNGYEQYVQDKIYETISSKGLQYLLHQSGGIFVIKQNEISCDEENLLLSCSDLIINAKNGFLKEQLYE